MAEVNYKIKRRSDDLFSTGGSFPRFTKKGKIWRTLGHLRSHLNSVGVRRGYQVYDDCEIVELVSNEHILCSVKTEIEDLERREQERHRVMADRVRQDRERREKEEQEAELNKLKQLLEKYPDFQSCAGMGVYPENEEPGKIIKRGGR